MAHQWLLGKQMGVGRSGEQRALLHPDLFSVHDAQVADQAQASAMQFNVDGGAELATVDAQPARGNVPALEHGVGEERGDRGIALARARLGQGLGGRQVDAFDAGQHQGAGGIEVDVGLFIGRDQWRQALQGVTVDFRQLSQLADVAQGQRAAQAIKRARQRRRVVGLDLGQGQQPLVAGTGDDIVLHQRAVEVEARAQIDDLDRNPATLDRERRGRPGPMLAQMGYQQAAFAAGIFLQLATRPAFATQGQLPELLVLHQVAAAGEAEPLAGEHIAHHQGHQRGDQQHAEQGNAALCTRLIHGVRPRPLRRRRAAE